MVIGDITGIVFGTVCDINHEFYGRPEKALQLILTTTVMEDINVECKVLADRVLDAIGYTAGNFPPEIGNKILTTFGAKHPFFGAHIPMDLETCFEYGRKAAEILESELAKAEEKKTGVRVPEVDETVDPEVAKTLLEYLRNNPPKSRGIVNASTKGKSKAELIGKIKGAPISYSPEELFMDLEDDRPYGAYNGPSL